MDLVNEATRRNIKVYVVCCLEEDNQFVAFDQTIEVVFLRMDFVEIANFIERTVDRKKSRLLITTAHDLYAPIAAKLAEHFSVPGPDSCAVTASVSKHIQFEIMNAMGLKRTTSVTLHLDESAPHDLIRDLQYPVVIKPIEGSASYGVLKCLCAENVLAQLHQLANVYREKPALLPTGRVVIEGFVPGQEYCAELFDGKFVGVMKKHKVPGPEFIERGYSSDVDLDDIQMNTLARTCEEVAKKTHLDWGPLHVDCIINNDALHIVEINPRLAGSLIPTIIRDAWGFDIIDALLCKLVGREVHVPTLRNPMRFVQVFFLLESDPEPWTLRHSGKLQGETLCVDYGPQLLSSRSRRAYLYTVVG